MTPPLEPPRLRNCTQCGDPFLQRANDGPGRSWCRLCVNAYQREYRRTEKGQEHVRKGRLALKAKRQADREARRQQQAS